MVARPDGFSRITGRYYALVIAVVFLAVALTSGIFDMSYLRSFTEQTGET